jgi:DNA (cytosine-5)-methyltransferase 1
MQVLDLFCGAGGAAMGLHQAWPNAEIVGVDIEPQPHYPFTFVQDDALSFDIDGYDFIWASPPCQAYSSVSGRARNGQRRKYPDLVAPIRERLSSADTPWVMENVPGSPLARVILLCGSMFGLDLRRHRHFESSYLMLAPSCMHHLQAPRFRSLDHRRSRQQAVIGVHGHLNYRGERELRQQAMGIDWMDDHELTQAIPPAYSRYIAQQFALEVS